MRIRTLLATSAACLLLSACGPTQILSAPRVVFVIPEPVECPDEPVLPDPDAPGFTQKTSADYTLGLRGSYLTCKANATTQKARIEKMRQDKAALEAARLAAERKRKRFNN